MSHLRPEDRSAKSDRASCRKGRHFYGDSQSIGGGIRRRVCDTCGEITIDLTGIEEVTTPVSRTGRIATLTPDS